jgi:DNA replication and repair protein RecF
MYPNYYHLLVDYNKIMKQRNNLLKSNKNKDNSEVMMSVWDEQLATVGSKIIIYRLNFLKRLKIIAHEIHSEISHDTEVLEIIYQSNYLPKNLEDEDLYDKIYSGILWLLKDKLSIDSKRGYTSVGPHRDDLNFFINGNESRKFASQGQVRTVALSLKLSEISIIKESLDERPILILDDVLSELDSIRQNQLVQYISELQTFITTTEINSLLYERISDAKMIQIKNGSITEGIYSGGKNGRN